MAGTGPDYHRARRSETPCAQCVYAVGPEEDYWAGRSRCAHPKIAMGKASVPVGRRQTCIYADDGRLP